MEIGYINGMNLGVGFNTATYDIHPTPALDNVLATRPVVNAGGQEVYFRVELASSTLSLTEQLSVTARASLKYGVTASGSAKTSFLSSFKQNSFTVYVLVQVLVTNEQTLLDLSKIELKTSAERLFASNSQAFTQQYGDSFIYGLITGGEFLGVLEIESTSAAEFREVKAKLSGKASYGLFSGNAKATFQQSLEQITSAYQMKATILRRGNTGALPQITPDNLVKEALDFPGTVTGNNGFPYSALVIPYNHIPHPVASPLDVSNQLTVLEQLGAWRQRLLKYQNDLAFALVHQDQFPGLDVNLVNDRYNKVSSEIANIVSSASACFTDQARCALPVIDLTLLENVLPTQIEGNDDMAGNRIAAGMTTPGSTAWQQYISRGTPDPNGIFVNVDTSVHGFSDTPIYVVSLHGTTHHWVTTGGSSPYNATKNGFSIYIKSPEAIDPTKVNGWGWHIQWIAISN